MEGVKQNPTETLAKEPEKLSLDNCDLTDKEFDDLFEFIDVDLEGHQDMQILHRNKDFSEGEVIVFFPEYLYVRHKAHIKSVKECTSLGMDVEHENTHDMFEYISRESIGSITASRSLSCDCDDCLAQIAKGQKEEQPEFYTVQIAGNRPHSLYGGDKHFSSWLADHLNLWRFKKGPFKYKEGVYKKVNPKSKKK